MAFVQANGNDIGGASATTIAVTLTGVTAGNLLVVAVACLHATATVTIDDAGNTWNAGPVLANATEPWQVRTFYAENVSGGSRTITATFSTATTYRSIYAQERSGLATSTSLESPTSGATVVLRQTTGTARNAGAYTNTADGDLVGFGYDYNWSSTPTAGAGMTARTAFWDSGGEAPANMLLPVDAAYTGSGSRSALWTMATGAISYCVQLFFRAAGGGGGGSIAAIVSYHNRLRAGQ